MTTLVMLPPQNDRTRTWARRLAEGVPGLDVRCPESHEESLADIGDADAAYGTPTSDQLTVAHRLRWLQAPAAAPPAGYYSDALVAHPVVVTNLRGIYNDHVATHAVAMLLALARGLPRYGRAQVDRRWEVRGDVVHLPEATVLVVGLGEIGSEIARLMHAFGCRIVATDARRTEAPPWVEELAPPDALDRLLPTADFVVLTVPHTPATEGLISARRLAAMKRSAHLVNIGRGRTVVLDDLTAALEAGTIAGAGLDVFEHEPLPADHPLWDAPGAILTPHVADSGPYLEERRFGVLLENARRFHAGEPLANVVDKAAWF